MPEIPKRQPGAVASRGFSVSGSRYPKGASGDTIAKLRLGGAPTPRSRVARMTKRPTPNRCGQERRLRGRGSQEEMSKTEAGVTTSSATSTDAQPSWRPRWTFWATSGCRWRAYRHQERQAIFVGDLIDPTRPAPRSEDRQDDGRRRQPQMVLATTSSTRWPMRRSGPPVREVPAAARRSGERDGAKNEQQHAAFLKQVTGAERERYPEMVLDAAAVAGSRRLRVVHACWHPTRSPTSNTSSGESLHRVEPAGAGVHQD